MMGFPVLIDKLVSFHEIIDMFYFTFVDDWFGTIWFEGKLFFFCTLNAGEPELKAPCGFKLERMPLVTVEQLKFCRFGSQCPPLY